MNRGSTNSTLNVLIGISLTLNITYMSIKFYKMFRDGKKKKPCECGENRG